MPVGGLSCIECALLILAELARQRQAGGPRLDTVTQASLLALCNGTTVTDDQIDDSPEAAALRRDIADSCKDLVHAFVRAGLTISTADSASTKTLVRPHHARQLATEQYEEWAERLPKDGARWRDREAIRTRLRLKLLQLQGLRENHTVRLHMATLAVLGRQHLPRVCFTDSA